MFICFCFFFLQWCSCCILCSVVCLSTCRDVLAGFLKATLSSQKLFFSALRLPKVQYMLTEWMAVQSTKPYCVRCFTFIFFLNLYSHLFIQLLLATFQTFHFDFTISHKAAQLCFMGPNSVLCWLLLLEKCILPQSPPKSVKNWWLFKKNTLKENVDQLMYSLEML